MSTEGPRWDAQVAVVGTGLVGTSIALAAVAAGARVLLYDVDPDRLAFAVDRAAGVPAPGLAALAAADLTVVAVPPERVGAAAVELLNAGTSVVTHVASVQHRPQGDVEASGADLARFCGGHPIAGRERSGPAHADPGLFRDRAWVVCPTTTTAAGTVAVVEALVAACGARPVRMGAAEHDALLARLSHAPQLVASALSASLVGLTGELAALAGSGMRDTTRIADSEPDLWAQIIESNREPVAAALQGAIAPLIGLADLLRADAPAADVDLAVRRLMEAGRAGRALLPGKHGRAPVQAAEVHVVVPDRPGALADLLRTIADRGVNLEDLRVEHAPGQPSGVAELVVAPASQQALVSALRAHGWSAVAGDVTAL
jgi:prephenate dehydrogenase